MNDYKNIVIVVRPRPSSSVLVRPRPSSVVRRPSSVVRRRPNKGKWSKHIGCESKHIFFASCSVGSLAGFTMHVRKRRPCW